MHRNNKGELMLFSRRTAIMGAIAGGLALYNDTSRAAIVNALRSDPEKDKNKVPHLPASILPEAVPLSGNVLNLNDRWQVNTDYAAVVDRLSMSNPKKDFVKFAIAGVIDVLYRRAIGEGAIVSELGRDQQAIHEIAAFFDEVRL